MTPFKPKAIRAAGPAFPAAIPVSTKMPAPIIAPTPIIVASNSVRSRANSIRMCCSSTAAASATALPRGVRPALAPAPGERVRSRAYGAQAAMPARLSHTHCRPVFTALRPIPSATPTSFGGSESRTCLLAGTGKSQPDQERSAATRQRYLATDYHLSITSSTPWPTRPARWASSPTHRRRELPRPPPDGAACEAAVLLSTSAAAAPYRGCLCAVHVQP